MYRKVGYVFGAAVGSFAVICGFKSQYLKDSHDELQFIQAASAQDVRKETENNERNVLLSPSVSREGYEKQNIYLQNAIIKARDLAYRKKDEVGAPGLVIGVSINGKTVWAEGELSLYFSALFVIFFYGILRAGCVLSAFSPPNLSRLLREKCRQHWRS
jgi:hypothetical protein